MRYYIVLWSQSKQNFETPHRSNLLSYNFKFQFLFELLKGENSKSTPSTYELFITVYLITDLSILVICAFYESFYTLIKIKNVNSLCTCL